MAASKALKNQVNKKPNSTQSGAGLTKRSTSAKSPKDKEDKELAAPDAKRRKVPVQVVFMTPYYNYSPPKPVAPVFNMLPNETILEILRCLNHWELFAIRRTSRYLKDNVELNGCLWETIYLPKLKHKRLTMEFITMLVEMGKKRVKEIVITTGAESKVLQELKKVVQLNSETLVILDLRITKEGRYLRDYSDFCMRFPKLKVYRFYHTETSPIVTLDIVHKAKPKPSALELNVDKVNEVSPQPYKVLWIYEIGMITHDGLQYFYDTKPFINKIQLSCLTSLRVEACLNAMMWYQILKPTVKSLKHLEIGLRKFDDWSRNPPPERLDLAHLFFPNLKILKVHGKLENFPYWLEMPVETILVSANIWNKMPDVEELWVKNVKDWPQRLAGRCPNLKTLKYHYEVMKEVEEENLLGLLNRRISEGFPIQTLIVPFKTCLPHQLEVMKGLVTHCLDLKDVPETIKLTVEI